MSVALVSSGTSSGAGTNSTTASFTVTTPSGTSQNNLLLLVVNVSTASTVTATGWTLVPTQSGGSNPANGGGFLYRIAGASDASTNYTVTIHGSTSTYEWGIAAFSGVDTTNPFDFSDSVYFTEAAASASSATTNAYDATVNGDLSVALWSQSDKTTAITVPANWTGAINVGNGSASGGRAVAVAYLTAGNPQASTVASLTWTLSGSVAYAVMYGAIRSADPFPLTYQLEAPGSRNGLYTPLRM